MVYIYKKIIAGKPYYYLRISERKGRKVIAKDVSYLGSTIEEVNMALKKLPQYKEEIRKAYRTINVFLESNYYLEKIKVLKLKKDKFLLEKLEEAEACKLHYNKVFNKKDDATKKEILRDFLIEFAFNTTSIEGNTINLEEARNLLQEGLTPKDKTLREIYDLQNTEKVFFWLYDAGLKEDLSNELIVRIHDKLMENIDARKGYRTADVRVLRSNFDATPAPFVKTDMDLLLKWHQENKSRLHPLVLATIFHHKFEKIHPFMDGNGRTGRMLLNYILSKNGYPPTIIHKKTRKEYLEAMRIADKSGLKGCEIKDYFELVQFNADEFTESYWSIFL
ncbi:MAG TPA: Fic family protein [Candidatus Nanoarchaeia archaeon]|nr:Fic family protein [Candidatus Nanoarchaeia archaeon]